MSEPASDRIGELRQRLDTRTGRDRLRRAAWVVLAASVLALVVRGGSTPDDPYVSASTRVPMSGFGQIAVRSTSGYGTVADWCALLAANAQQRQRGLMNQTGLNGYDAMLFRYDQPSNDQFWMKSTLIPLTVAFFDASGHFISSQDMEPCPASLGDGCPRYPAAAPYTSAIEVVHGGLAELGIGPGAVISFPGGPCPS